MIDTGDNHSDDQEVVRDGAEKIKGVFSSQTISKVGTGTTQRRTIQKTYWSCEEMADGCIEIQPLNFNYVPSGPKRSIDRDSFLASYNPEPEFYMTTVYPAIKQVDDAIVRGEQHRERGAAYSAEFEFKQAMAVDEENVRANFGLGLTYLDRGDEVRANDIFERIVDLEAAFEEEHKHLFNDFGINMRKNKMLDQALQYYLRAEELVTDDEHLLHNIARCYYEKGDIKGCRDYLEKSLQLNPNLEESAQFWTYLKRQGLIAEDEEPNIGSDAILKDKAPSIRLDGAPKDEESGVSPKDEAPSINLDTAAKDEEADMNLDVGSSPESLSTTDEKDKKPSGSIVIDLD